MREPFDYAQDIDEFRDPGGQVVAQLDQCYFCAGSGESWNGWQVCGLCFGSGFIPLEDSIAVRSKF